jgi:hypothetical protein
MQVMRGPGMTVEPSGAYYLTREEMSYGQKLVTA